MFAPLIRKPTRASTQDKPGRAYSALPGKDSSAHNNLWQSLAMRLAPIRPKLTVGPTNDPHEHEADHIADRVMRMPRSQSGNDRLSFSYDASPNAQCKGDPHRPERKHLRRKELSLGAIVGGAVPSIVHHSLRSPGQPLDPGTLALMEPRFGCDFSDVRVHTDAQAAASADVLSAGAYTLGSDIVFASGAFAPATSDGQRLLAHELTHVVQQSSANPNSVSQRGETRGAFPISDLIMRDFSPDVRRAPALKGHTTAEKVDDSIAGAIDKALAESPSITKYIPAKNLKKESGHIDVDDPAVFEAHYRDYGKTVKDLPDVKDVAGFTDRKAGKIYLKLHVADVEAALHEAIHLNSGSQFANNFGHACNEGVTEHFTEKVLEEQKLKPGKAYRDELKMARGLIEALDEDQVGRAYFKGELAPYRAVLQALTKASDTGFSKWHALINSKDPADWEKATKLLKQAFGK